MGYYVTAIFIKHSRGSVTVSGKTSCAVWGRVLDNYEDVGAQDACGRNADTAVDVWVTMKDRVKNYHIRGTLGTACILLYFMKF